MPLRNILRGLGMEWREHKKSVLWRPHLSKQTRRFDYFFSHDWATSGWLKYLTLLCFLNSSAAALTSFLGGLSFGILVAFEVLPRTVLWNLLCGSAAQSRFFKTSE